MQFLFGMAMLQLIVTMTMWYVKAHIWVAKWILRTSWRAMRLAWRQIQNAIETQRSNRAFRAAAERRDQA